VAEAIDIDRSDLRSSNLGASKAEHRTDTRGKFRLKRGTRPKLRQSSGSFIQINGLGKFFLNVAYHSQILFWCDRKKRSSEIKKVATVTLPAGCSSADYRQAEKIHEFLNTLFTGSDRTKKWSNKSAEVLGLQQRTNLRQIKIWQASKSSGRKWQRSDRQWWWLCRSARPESLN